MRWWLRIATPFAVLSSVACGSNAPEPAVPSDAIADDLGVEVSVDASTSDGSAADGSTGDAIADADEASTPPVIGTPYVYVGLGSGEIAQLSFDVESGALVEKARVAAGAMPSFLAVDPTHRHLYAVNEGSEQVAAFSIAKGTGALTLQNRVSSHGAGPAFVSVDATGKNVLVANYGGGTVTVLRVEADGRLGAKVSGDAPGPKAHAILAEPSNRFVYAPTLGADAVAQWAFDATTGALTPLSPPKVSFAAGAGPRHVAFAPSGKHAFVVNEFDDTVVSLSIDATTGALTPKQTLSTLPAGFDGAKNTGADVHVHPSGKHLYTSNRGHDSIAQFAVAADGTLTAKGHTSTGGKTPRNFGIDPSGRVLLAANQGSGNVVTFRIDPTTGALTKLVTTSLGAAPYWVGVVVVPD